MKLVKNWKSIAARSHSMWAGNAGLTTLVLPEMAYLALKYQVVNPYVSGYVGVALLVYGLFGRILDQGIGDA